MSYLNISFPVIPVTVGLIYCDSTVCENLDPYSRYELKIRISLYKYLRS